MPAKLLALGAASGPPLNSDSVTISRVPTFGNDLERLPNPRHVDDEVFDGFGPLNPQLADLSKCGPIVRLAYVPEVAVRG